MLIDCQTCVARDIACHDCVVTVLLSTSAPSARGPGRVQRPGPAPVEIDDDAREAIAHLAGAGLVPPLRLVSARSERQQDIA
jgi:hypothetical protein